MRPRKARGTPGLELTGPGESMAEDKTTPPNDEVIAVSDEALQKAESFVEAEEGAANRLMGWAGKISTTIAVVMSLFHLYAAYAIVPTQELRYIHVAFTLVLSFLLFPLATRFRNRVRWWDIVPGIVAVATIVYALWGGEDFTDRATTPDRWDIIVGIVFIVLLLEATRRTTGAIMPVVSLLFIAYAMLGPYLPAPMDPSRLRRGPPGRSPLHYPGRHFRRRCRRIGDADHPVHHLWRIPAAIRRRQVLHRLLAGADGRKAEQRRPHGRAVVVPARRPLRIGRRHDRHDRHRGLSDDGQGGLREERRGWLARGRRAGRDPVAAGAGRRRVPDRRVSQDQLSRRDLDGDHPDLSLLHVAVVHGRTGRQEVRREGCHLQAGNDARPDDDALRLPLRLAARRRRLHGDRLLADAVGVLCHRRHLCIELPAQGNRAGADQAGEGAGRRLDRRAQRRDHLRLRRHRRRRRDADGSWPQILVDRHQLCRRQPIVDRDLYLADRLDHRPRGAGDGFLHHLRGDRGARADQARRARLRRAHVHLLLCCSLRGVAADGAFAVRGGRHHRWRPLQDHAAILEIHPAGVPGAVRVRARPAGRRPAAVDPEGRVMGRYCRDHDQDDLRPVGAGGLCPELGAATKYSRSSAACFCYPGCCWCFQA